MIMYGCWKVWKQKNVHVIYGIIKAPLKSIPADMHIMGQF